MSILQENCLCAGHILNIDGFPLFSTYLPYVLFSKVSRIDLKSEGFQQFSIKYDNVAKYLTVTST